MKVSHHGAQNGTTAELVKAIQPFYAIISAGADNAYGHPHPETMALLSGIETYQTAEHGSIEFVTDGDVVELFYQ